MKDVKKINLIGFATLMIGLSNFAYAFNPIEVVQLATDKTMQINQKSDNIYTTYKLGVYSTCGVASAYWEWTQSTKWWPVLDRTSISYGTNLNLSNGTGIGDFEDQGGGWPWNTGFGSWYSNDFLNNWIVTPNSTATIYFQAADMRTFNVGGPTIYSANLKLAMVCPSVSTLPLPIVPIFISNPIDHVLRSYKSSYSANLKRTTGGSTPIETIMDPLELKGLVLRRYNVKYSITTSNKLKSTLTLAKETVPFIPNFPSTNINFPIETGLDEGTYQTKVVQKDILLTESSAVTKTFNINPIRRPTLASLILNSNKSISLKWTAPSLTLNGTIIDNTTWAGYHFYIYNSAGTIAYAFASASINPGVNNLVSPILPLPSGTYTVKIVPHLQNGGNGIASTDLLTFVMP